MSLSVPENALIVVADGEKATFYRNVSFDSVKIKFKEDLVPKDENFKGPAPTPTQTSQQEIHEATFAKNIADRLYKIVHAGECEKMVLIADPQTLGQMRPSLHKEVLNTVICELPKDLTNSTIEDIEKTLKAA